MQKIKYRRKNLFGGALISALFITAIAAIIAVAMTVQQRLLIHEGELVLNADQNYLNLECMRLQAKNEIVKYVMQWMNPKNAPSQLIPLKNKLPQLKINNTVLTGTIDDEQGKFNINDLIYSDNQPRFVALLQAVVQGIPRQESYNIAKAITAWVSNNSQDPYYLSLHPAYRAPQREMVNISELRLVNGITPIIFSALAPYITALPIAQSPVSAAPTAPTASTSTPINVNSASAPVFLTTDPTLTLAQAQQLATCRKQYGGFTNVATFMADCAKSGGITALNNVVTTSEYFLVQSQAVFNHHVVSLNSLLVTRITKDNKLKIVTVWQSFE